MNYTFIIKYKTGKTTKEHYNKKIDFCIRQAQLLFLGKEEKTIKCFWVWQDSKPEERKRFNF